MVAPTLEDIFHRFAAENCADVCGTTEPHLTFQYRIKRTGRAIGTGNYNHTYKRVRVTLGTSTQDNIATMLHELAHHIVFMKYGNVKTHGHTFYDVYYNLLMKYEKKMPGLCAAEVSYQGKRNGIWLWKAMDRGFAGARETYNYLVEEVERKNKIIREQNAKINAQYAARTANAFFEEE